ncbi:MAG: site-2 protease family protein [Eubacteriales bacterium]|nr:site-2 protease family protein [Eubacteriales bacterium]
MFSLIVSIIALGVIITIHEFGHFLAARACGVGVIEFSIGMGPRLISTVRGNTRYSLRMLPFGGSCMMLGEEMEEDGFVIDGRKYKREEQFVNKRAWQRFIIIFAGPLFNFILAFLLSLVITGMYGFDRPVIVDVAPNMAASEAGIEAGDEIYKISIGRLSTRVECARDVSVFTTIHQEEMQEPQSFTIFYKDASDGGKKKQAELVPTFDKENGRYRLGFSYSLAYKPAGSVPKVVLCSIYNVKYCIRSSIESLRLLFSGKVGREDVMGPVRMVAVMDESVEEAAGYGVTSAMVTLFDLMILISGSIGFMNLMPLPALDGGRLIFILIELVTGHTVPKELESKVHMAGMLLLLLLMFMILANDITMLIFSH